MARQPKDSVPLATRVHRGEYRYLLWPLLILGAACIFVATANGSTLLNILGGGIIGIALVSRGYTRRN
jgi:hypothetical protein